jgi:integrase/recombinase XerD
MILMTKIYDVKSFEVHLASRGFADNSIKSFASDIRQFIDSELDPEGYLEDLKRKGYKNSTLMRKRASLINYYKFKGEPIELFPIKVEQQLPFVLTQQEVKALLKEALKTRNPKRDRLLIELMLRAGLKLAEVLNLTPSDLQEDKGITYLLIRHPNSKRNRKIPIVDKGLVKSLRGYIHGIPLDAPVFDISRSSVEQIVKSIAIKVGIKKKIHPQTLRHTAVTLYLKNGMNIESIRRMLGHTNLSTTQKYLQLTDKDIAKDLEKANW